MKKRTLALLMSFTVAISGLPVNVLASDAADMQMLVEEDLFEDSIENEETIAMDELDAEDEMAFEDEDESVETEVLFDDEDSSAEAFFGDEAELLESGIPSALTDEINSVVEFDDSMLGSTEELFQGYVESMFYNGFGISPFNVVEYDLNENEMLVFSEMQTVISEIASGQRSSTEFSIACDDEIDLSWTYEELGVSGWDDANRKSSVGTAFGSELNTSKLLDYLIFSHPYELYWFAKSTKGALDISYSYGGSDEGIFITSITMRFIVEPGFRGDTIYTADTSKTSATSNAVATAQYIIEEGEEFNDYEKLNYYREVICELVSYNEDAIAEDYSAAIDGIDPWQIINVFDGDPSTNVVCEGYAKAFQYLCDQSVFESEDINCISVSGYMDGGAHMWNIVRMDDGLNYLVDVTNCDGDSIGAPDKLFLAGVPGEWTNGNVLYEFVFDRLNQTSYWYDLETLGCYDEEWLTLADTYYDPNSTECAHAVIVTAPAIAATCTESGLTEGSYCKKCGEIIVNQTVIPALGHIEVMDAAIEATCAATGLTEGKHCDRCGAEIIAQTVIEKKEHTLVDLPEVPATGSTTGLTAGKQCSVCKEFTVKQDIIPKVYLNNPKLISATLNTDSIDVKWYGDESAEQYRIFRKTSTSNWVTIATVKASDYDLTADKVCTYRDKNVVSGNVYTYTVRAITFDAKTYMSGFDSTGKSVKYVAAPIVSAIANAEKGVTVKWTVSTGAAKYRLFRKTDSTSWAKIADVTGNSYTDTTAVSGTTYTYTVRCLNSNGSCASMFNDGKSITYVAAPVISAIANTNEGVSIKWNAPGGSQGKYRIYRKYGSVNWTAIADITGNTYVDKATVSGTKYTYTIRCLNENNALTSSFNSAGKTLVRLSTGSVSVLANAASGINVKWNKVNGATGYWLYRKAGTGSYQKIATISGGTVVSYADTKATANGTLYTYAVRPVNGSVLGGYTEKGIYRIATPAKPILSNSASKTLKVAWTKNTAASGYQVYYKVGSIAKTLTISGNATVAQLIKNLSVGATYSVQIRSYKTVNGVNYFSAWSAAASLKLTR